MALPKRKRQLLRVLAACLVVAVALVLLFPVWFPWTLKPLAQVLGARFQSCQRLEHQELALHGFSFSNRVVDLQVRYARFPMPHAWLWRLQSAPGTNSHFLRASGVQLVVTPIKTGRPGSVYSNALQVIQISKVLRRWAPQALVTNGSLRVDQFSLTTTQAHWLNGKLDADIRLPQSKAWERLTADLSGSSPYALTLHSGTLQADSTHQISVSNSGLDLASTILWRTNRATLTAHFGHYG
ncbi:MAG TPA: hypothetical protein VN673_01015, partial [Clostridia bacterium]|nr:hypothetical protein [Clostridia bacterium]